MNSYSLCHDKSIITFVNCVDKLLFCSLIIIFSYNLPIDHKQLFVFLFDVFSKDMSESIIYVWSFINTLCFQDFPVRNSVRTELPFNLYLFLFYLFKIFFFYYNISNCFFYQVYFIFSIEFSSFRFLNGMLPFVAIFHSKVK